jgi:D-serine deaminase-like pyridoxal phosphate-dependent protein
MAVPVKPRTTVETLDTPALVVDLDRLEANISRWAAAAREAGVKLRPHAKTHKCVEIARRQMAAGATGLTLAKIGEAEVMARAGISDIFIANEMVGDAKMARLLALARSARVRVGVDSTDVAEPLAKAAQAAGMTLDVLLEVDTGLGRCGVAPGDPLLALAQEVARLRGVRIAGIFTYRGYQPTMEAAGREEGEIMVRQAERLRAVGIPAEEVSVGSTPTGRAAARVRGVTEIRPGTYVFNDAMQVRWGAATPDECALTVLARVISRPSRDVAILDAGSKVLTAEHGPFSSLGESHGTILDHPDCQIDRLWEEHGRVRLTGDALRLRVGDLVNIVPTHVCPTVNLAEQLVCARRGRIEETWAVAARAKVQ